MKGLLQYAITTTLALVLLALTYRWLATTLAGFVTSAFGQVPR